MKRSKTFGEWINHYIKRIDAYAVPVSLTYKGQPKIQSLIGGWATIMSRLVVLAFFVY
jgi:hypothetical protein